MGGQSSASDIRANIAVHREAGTCYLCQKPVVAGEMHHGATGAHWDCTKQLEAQVPQTDTKLRMLKHSRRTPRAPRKREGDGALALKAKALAAAALEAALGSPIWDLSIWNQKGAHRGARWDLDAWGLHFKFDMDGKAMGGSASSLSTMTQCVKWGKLVALPAGNAYSFDLAQAPAPTASARHDLPCAGPRDPVRSLQQASQPHQLAGVPDLRPDLGLATAVGKPDS